MKGIRSMDIRCIIEKLSAMRAVSGYEFRISESISDMFKEYCPEVIKDPLGSVIGIMPSYKDNAPTVMIEAHIDEIGMMITDIDERGFLLFTNIGGIDPRILPAKEVIIHGSKDIRGIIGAKPPHVTTSEQREKTIPLDELYIDTGYNGDEVREFVTVGNTVTFAHNYRELGEDFVSTKSHDDRTGVAVLVSLMDRLKDVRLPFNIHFCACVQEEVGRRGALPLATYVDPVFAISIDVCHASTPDASEGTFKCGSGTVISKGPNIHPVLCKRVTELMDREGIKYNIDVDGDDTGTDAWAIQTALYGIPTILFSLPLKYMHTMVETVHLDDVKSTVDAIYTLVTNTEDAEEAVCRY